MAPGEVPVSIVRFPHWHNEHWDPRLRHKAAYGRTSDSRVEHGFALALLGFFMTHDWNLWQPTIRATLIFIVDEARERVLLIRKKRGLGAGKINGPGGKIDPGEGSVACAIRETQEELGVTALDPVHHGELWFQFMDGLALHVDVYRATQWEGQPVETVEAIPLWTPLNAIPFEEMWEDDRYWLSEVLTEKKNFVGRFLFEDDRMLTNEVKWVEMAAAVTAQAEAVR